MRPMLAQSAEKGGSVPEDLNGRIDEAVLPSVVKQPLGGDQREGDVVGVWEQEEVGVGVGAGVQRGVSANGGKEQWRGGGEGMDGGM